MRWFEITLIDHRTWRIADPIGRIEPRFGVETVNLYLVAGQDRAALIDTGMGIGDLGATVRALCDLPVIVCNTHFHWDHSNGNQAFDQIAIHQVEVELLAKEPDMSGIRAQFSQPAVRAILPDDFDPAAYRFRPTTATRALNDGDTIELGGRSLRIIHTPGHSIGHVCYCDEAAGLLFSGDMVYCGPMYACFRGSDPAAFHASAQRLSRMADKVQLIAPGHNQTLAGGGFLQEVADAVDAALSGRVESGPADDFIGGRPFRFGAFSVWFPS